MRALRHGKGKDVRSVDIQRRPNQDADLTGIQVVADLGQRADLKRGYEVAIGGLPQKEAIVGTGEKLGATGVNLQGTIIVTGQAILTGYPALSARKGTTSSPPIR